MKIPLKQIYIGDRQRVDLGDVEGLAETMRPPPDGVGQITPIIVTDDFRLIEGRRRLEAATMLGWYDIEAVTKSGLTEAQKQEMELIADVQRKDRTWQEKCTAMAKVHRLKSIEHGLAGSSWTLRMMAELTGTSKTHTDYMLTVADALEKNPTVAKECESFADAYKKLIILPKEQEIQREMERREALRKNIPQEQLASSDVLIPDITMQDDSLTPVEESEPGVGDNDPPHTYNKQVAQVLGSSNSDDWGTDPVLFSKLDEEFHFDLDVNADVTNHKCENYFTIKQNSLIQDWSKHRCFCNPPFTLNYEFVQKSHEEAKKGALVVLLIPARTMSSWFHEFVWDNSNHCVRPGVAIRFYKGGIKYIGTAGSGAPFPVMLVVFNPYLK